MSYPPVNLYNGTSFTANGSIDYALCRSDAYDLQPQQSRGFERGSCLVTRISAQLQTPGGPVWAQPYESSGTSYSQYAILSNGNNTYTVARVSYADDDAAPADDGQPGEQPAEQPK